MIKQLRDIALGSIEASKPSESMIGQVTGVDPLEITVDQRLVLDADLLLVTERVKRYVVSLTHSHVYKDETPSEMATKNTQTALPDVLVIREGLKMGDAVLLQRMKGGQQFAVIDKLVSA
ncbi:DUF2577 domain-containing protein [Paenibacillus polymyxa]|uniref:DUF2577 domain-containing protein n=1 Tax=Paenibacillus polymyxa TaxID=1406 RepID=UPI0024BF9343|nr:DUF2577 domain-containing protein [Paenibacillus polymyxa]WHX37419.1 DUF2577 domain-containing protein [Paenibacillus polymyxa]